MSITATPATMLRVPSTIS